MNTSKLPWPKSRLGRISLSVLLIVIALIFWPLTLTLGALTAIFFALRWFVRRARTPAARAAVTDVVRAPLWRRPLVLGSFALCALLVIVCAISSGSHSSQLSAASHARMANRAQLDQYNSWSHTGELAGKGFLNGAFHGAQGDVKGAVIDGIQMVREDVAQGRQLRDRDRQLTAYQQQLGAAKSQSDGGIVIGFLLMLLVCGFVVFRILRARKRHRLQPIA